MIKVYSSTVLAYLKEPLLRLIETAAILVSKEDLSHKISSVKYQLPEADTRLTLNLACIYSVICLTSLHST